MLSLARAITAVLIGLAAAGAAGPTLAEDDAYYPAAAAGKNAPLWERPKFTHFSATRCSPGGAAVDQLVLNRDDVSQTMGPATYTDTARDKSGRQGAGGWTLSGDALIVAGDGFVLDGRWDGPFLTATITRPGGEPVRCRFQVQALRSFTQYQ